MDQETKEILANIARIQLEALKRIKDNIDFTDKYLLCKLLNISNEDIFESLDKHINLYESMESCPQIVRTLTEYQLDICTHILFKLEDEWMIDNSQGVMGAWSTLLSSKKKFHPELTLII